MSLRFGLWDLPKIAWQVLLWLEISEITAMRLVSRRLRELASADMVWLTLAKTVLLVRHIMPRDCNEDVMRVLTNRVLCAETLHGTYTYAAAPGAADQHLFVKAAELRITHGRLGFNRPVGRVHLKVTLAAQDLEDVCVGTLRYRLHDRRFHIVTRRKGLRGWVSGPQFTLLAAPHRKPWMGESREHFETVAQSGLRLILTVDRPGSWATAFGCEVNAIIAVARRAPELALDVDGGGGTSSQMPSPSRSTSNPQFPSSLTNFGSNRRL